MGQLNLPLRGLVYLDSDALIYLVEKIQPYSGLLLPLLQAVKAGPLQLVGSELLLLETLVKPVEQGDQRLEADFRRFLTSSRDMNLIPISQVVLEQALVLRVQHRLRTPDSIHAATALLAPAALFVTNDPAFRRVSGLAVALRDDCI